MSPASTLFARRRGLRIPLSRELPVLLVIAAGTLLWVAWPSAPPPYPGGPRTSMSRVQYIRVAESKNDPTAIVFPPKDPALNDSRDSDEFELVAAVSDADPKAGFLWRDPPALPPALPVQPIAAEASRALKGYDAPVSEQPVFVRMAAARDESIACEVYGALHDRRFVPDACPTNLLQGFPSAMTVPCIVDVSAEGRVENVMLENPSILPDKSLAALISTALYRGHADRADTPATGRVMLDFPGSHK